MRTWEVRQSHLQRNGKVWNFQNGHNLQCLEPVAEAEVTGVMPLADRNIILAVGWSRLITSYDNSDPDNMYLKATTAWKGGQLHQDDILSIDFCPPNFLATSSFDGEIIVWNLETEKIFVRLNKGSPTNIFRRIESMQTKSNNATPMNSRPNSRHRKIHKVPKGQVAPVDKLLFLKARANVKNPDSAILVSSGGGWLQWWCLYGAKNELGCFYVPELADESVLGVCTGPDNNMLVTGDTQGIVQVWKISDYCVKSQEVRVETKPPLEAIWQAHDSAIVSVDFVSHPLGDFILTASTDRTARLWNISGHYIGTLGQKSLWDLTNPSTWAHPESPWTLQPKDVSAVEGDSLSMEETESKRVNSSHTYVKELTNEKLVLPSVTESKMTDITDIRSSVETCLGHKAEKELARKKQDRHDRWENFGEVSVQQTSRFGKLCSPYQALFTPKVLEVELPKNLPLSQRMINKGITADNINDEALKNFDFSFGEPDSSTRPSIEHQPNISSKTIEEKNKSSSAKLGKMTNKIILKKNNTII